MIFQAPTPEDRLRSRARVHILISPARDQLADLALREAELASDPAAAESALVSRVRQVVERGRGAGPRHPLVLTACATLVVGGDSMTAIWQ